MKKTILFIFHQKDFDGGASRSVISIIERLLSDSNYNIIAITPKNGQISNYLRKLNIQCFIEPYKYSMAKKDFKWIIKKLIFPVINELVLNRLYFKLKNIKIDLVYTNTSVIEIGFYLSQKLNCNHIYHVREFGKEDFSLEYLYSLKRRRKLLGLKNTKIITISNSLKQKYIDMISRNDIELIYNGIEDNFNQKNYISKDIINFLQVGTINFGKNQLEVLKAAKVLKNKDIYNFKINFVGPEEKTYKEILQNYIKENSLEKYVEFLGNKNSEELKNLIQRFDVGLMLSLKEAFGRVTVEYMLGGMPVIASNTGANPELIRENQNGYLYNIGDIDSLAQKLELFIKDNLKIKEIGVKAREIAFQNYLAETNYQKIKKVIDSQIQ